MFTNIKWLALPHCPEGQLQKGGDPTDAGFDLKISEDALVLPYSMMDFEWEKVGPLDSFSPELQAKFLKHRFDGIQIDEDVLYRKKYAFSYIPTGIKIQPDVLGWNAIYPRSGASTKYGCGLANSVGVIDFKFGGELKITAYAYYSPTVFRRGERIAQLVPRPQLNVAFQQVSEDEFTNTRSGFGSSGMFEIPSPR